MIDWAVKTTWLAFIVLPSGRLKKPTASETKTIIVPNKFSSPKAFLSLFILAPLVALSTVNEEVNKANSLGLVRHFISCCDCAGSE